jgi:sporulation protein YlmC with PRC-barrel domain
MKIKMQALSMAIAMTLMQTTAAQQAAPPATGAERSNAAEDQYSKSMEKLQQAAQRLREAVQAMAAQQAGPQRNAAMKQVNDALTETQAAMAQLPPELRQASGDGKSGSTAQTKQLRDVRLSQLIGEDVRNRQGEDLGDVKDLVIDTSENQVKYVVIEFGGFLGLGQKLFAFPLSAFSQAAGDGAASNRTAPATAPGLDASPVVGDRAASGTGAVPADRRAPEDRGTRTRVWSNSNELVLNVDKERLEKAPGFENQRWPDFSDAGFRGEIDRYWGTTQSGQQRAAGGEKQASETAEGKSPPMIKPTSWRASDLLDTQVVGEDGDDIGKIEDLVVNAQTGELRYAVIAFDRGWFRSDKPVAVPADSLTPLSERRVSFSGKKEQLADAPSFDREKWPDLNEPGFRTRVDPYLDRWNRGSGTASTPAGGSGTAGTGSVTKP